MSLSSCALLKTDWESTQSIWQRRGHYVDAVPDERTAIQIGEAVMIPVYGRREVLRQRPQIAELRGRVWYVHGYQPPSSPGGTIEAYIDKHSGRILAVTNGGE